MERCLRRASEIFSENDFIKIPVYNNAKHAKNEQNKDKREKREKRMDNVQRTMEKRETI